MNRSDPSRLRFRWSVAFIAGGLTLAMSVAGVRWHRTWLAERLHQRLVRAAEVPDEEVAVRLEQLAKLGEQGLPAVVAALHHDHQEVRSVVQTFLDEQLVAWQQLPASESSRRVRVLAEQLAQHSSTATPEMLRASATYALQCLAWPRGERTSGPGWAHACEQVLVAARRAGALQEVLPGRGDDSQELITVSLRDEPSLGMPPSTVPRNLPAPEVSEKLPPKIIPKSPVDSSDPRGNRDPPAELPRLPPAEWVSLADDELIERVGDPSFRAAALDELRRRGFSDMDLQVARAAVDPDPRRRESLAQTLPQLTGIDIRSWLLWMLHDESPRVRAVAARWLATSNDPDLHQHLRDLAREETDETVRQALRSIDTVHRR